MVDQNFAKMKGFLRQGRLVNSDGTYEVIGRISLQNTCEERDSLIEKLKAANSGIYSYEFGGPEALLSLKFIADVIKNDIPDKECTLFTSAPCKYWWNTEYDDTETWRLFQKIIVRRFGIDDKDNNNLLKTEALKENDYLSMNPELKKRIAFFVDYKQFNLNGSKDRTEDMMKFINWAKRIGIKEVIFLEDEEEMISARKEYREELERRKNEQIAKMRSGRFKINQCRNEKIKCRTPLFLTVRNMLIREGWNLQATKATEEGDKFFVLMTVKDENMKIVFKTKLLNNTSPIWDMARSHKYIQEIK